MSTDIGYHDYKGTGPAFDGLASELYQVISITVDGDTRDGENINTDDLRAGMTLQIDSTTGKYAEFWGNHATMVILAEPLYDLSDNGDQVATAYWTATFKKGSTIDTTTVTWASQPRYNIRLDY